MATGLAEVAYRPIRIGMLIRDGSRDDLLAAIRLNTVLWGGAFNPVVQIGRSERRADYVVRHVPVDVLHPIADRAPLRRVIERHRELEWPPFGGLIQAEGNESRLAAVDVDAVLPGLRPPRDTAGGRLRGCVPFWDDSDPFALVFAAT